MIKKFKFVLYSLSLFYSCQNMAVESPKECGKETCEIKQTQQFKSIEKVLGLKKISFCANEEVSIRLNYNDLILDHLINASECLVDFLKNRDHFDKSGSCSYSYSLSLNWLCSYSIREFLEKIERGVSIKKSSLDLILNQNNISSFVLLKKKKNQFYIKDFKKYLNCLGLSKILSNSDNFKFSRNVYRTDSGILRIFNFLRIKNVSRSEFNNTLKPKKDENWKFSKRNMDSYSLFSKSEFIRIHNETKNLTFSPKERFFCFPTDGTPKLKSSYLPSDKKDKSIKVTNSYCPVKGAYFLNQDVELSKTVFENYLSDSTFRYFKTQEKKIENLGSEIKEISEVKKELHLKKRKLETTESTICAIELALEKCHGKLYTLNKKLDAIPQGFDAIRDFKSEKKLDLLQKNIQIVEGDLTKNKARKRKIVSELNLLEKILKNNDSLDIVGDSNVQSLGKEGSDICKNPFKNFSQKYLILELLKIESHRLAPVKQVLNCFEQLVLNMHNHRKLSEHASWLHLDDIQGDLGLLHATKMAYRVKKIFKDKKGKVYPLEIDLEEDSNDGTTNRVTLKLDYKIEKW